MNTRELVWWSHINGANVIDIWIIGPPSRTFTIFGIGMWGKCTVDLHGGVGAWAVLMIRYNCHRLGGRLLLCHLFIVTGQPLLRLLLGPRMLDLRNTTCLLISLLHLLYQLLKVLQMLQLCRVLLSRGVEQHLDQLWPLTLRIIQTRLVCIRCWFSMLL